LAARPKTNVSILLNTSRFIFVGIVFVAAVFKIVKSDVSD